MTGMACGTSMLGTSNCIKGAVGDSSTVPPGCNVCCCSSNSSYGWASAAAVGCSMSQAGEPGRSLISCRRHVRSCSPSTSAVTGCISSPDALGSALVGSCRRNHTTISSSSGASIFTTAAMQEACSSSTCTTGGNNVAHAPPLGIMPAGHACPWNFQSANPDFGMHQQLEKAARCENLLAHAMEEGTGTWKAQDDSISQLLGGATEADRLLADLTSGSYRSLAGPSDFMSVADDWRSSTKSPVMPER
jgi:hypothetical protein